MKQLLYRNARARDFLEAFLVSAVSSLLLVRFYLHLTGYPQIGGSLHIAHMLWGGLLMMIALVLSLAFLGQRIKWLISIIGGIGFGIFIDELGKFITRDNNYFFKPTIGIIYALFVVLYLAFNFLSRTQVLTSREYQLNAVMELEEAIAQDMDPGEKARVQQLLDQADQKSIITRQLRALLNELEAVKPVKPWFYRRVIDRVDKAYQEFWQRRSSKRLVQVFFAIETGIFLLAVGYVLYNNFDSVIDIFRGPASYSKFLVIGQLVSTLVATSFAVRGIARLQRRRVAAFELFRRAVLVNLFLTEFFIFCRQQFGALPGFALNLIIFILIDFVLNQEIRLGSQPNKL
jgi:hypothetical protein